MSYPNIPSQNQGEFHDIVSMQCANSITDAIKNFQKLKSRLCAVNNWDTYSDQVKTAFTLIDSETQIESYNLKIDNFIRIDIPGPGNPSGNGYDWTKIINIEDKTKHEDYPYFAITIKPCAAPDSDNNTVAHFYTEASTNTFIIRRIGTCIYAEVHGRNQIQNTAEVPILDTMRNKAISVGANLGLGGLNWLAFTNALLKSIE